MKSTYRMLLGLAVALILAMPSPVTAQTDHELIKALGTCYARGTDLLGSAIHYPPQADTNTLDLGLDPHFTQALALYHECFASDFEFNIILSSGAVIPFAALVGGLGPDPALQWANFVNRAFRGALWDCPDADNCNTNQYESTQHQLGSLFVSVEGKKGKTGFLESYLTATHTFHIDAFGVSLDRLGRTGVSVAYGTYQNVVVKEKGKRGRRGRNSSPWKIQTRDLILRRGLQIPALPNP